MLRLREPLTEPLRRRDSGRQAGQFLDHSSLAVTTVYLRRLEGQQDQTWGKVAAAIGV